MSLYHELRIIITQMIEKALLNNKIFTRFWVSCRSVSNLETKISWYEKLRKVRCRRLGRNFDGEVMWSRSSAPMQVILNSKSVCKHRGRPSQLLYSRHYAMTPVWPVPSPFQLLNVLAYLKPFLQSCPVPFCHNHSFAWKFPNSVREVGET